MKIVTLVLAVVSLILAVILVNAAYRLYMKIIGADAMFFSRKTKLVAIFVVFLVIFSLIVSVFNLNQYFE